MTMSMSIDLRCMLPGSVRRLRAAEPVPALKLRPAAWKRFGKVAALMLALLAINLAIVALKSAVWIPHLKP
jgi:hypothetical protein